MAIVYPRLCDSDGFDQCRALDIGGEMLDVIWLLALTDVCVVTCTVDALLFGDVFLVWAVLNLVTSCTIQAEVTAVFFLGFGAVLADVAMTTAFVACRDGSEVVHAAAVPPYSDVAFLLELMT